MFDHTSSVLRAKKRAWYRGALGIGIVVALLLLLAIGIARVRFNGPALAGIIERAINEKIRGQVQIRDTDWPLSKLYKLVTGGFLPITMEGIQVYDERGATVVRAPAISGEMHLGTFLYGHHDFTFRNIHVPSGAYLRIEEWQQSERKRDAMYDRSTIGILAAFYGKRSHTERLGSAATRSTIYDIEDLTVEDCEVEIIFPEIEIRAEHVSGSGFLYADGTDPLSYHLYYALQPKAKQAHIHLVPGELDLEVIDLSLSRLEQLPMQWPKDVQGRDFEWAMTATTVTGSPVAFTGSIEEFWTDRFGGRYDAVFTLQRAGNHLAEWSGGYLFGEDAGLSAIMKGPTFLPTMRLSLDNVRVNLPGWGTAVPASLGSLTLDYDTATDTGQLRPTELLLGGGALDLTAGFSAGPFQVTRAAISSKPSKPVNLRKYVPKAYRHYLGSGTVTGSMQGSGDIETQDMRLNGVRFGDFVVDGRIFSHTDHIADLDDLLVRVGKTSAFASGTINFFANTLDLQIRDIDAKDLDSRLQKWQLPSVATSAQGSARVQGPMDNPTANAKIQLQGVPLVDTVATQIGYQDNQLVISELESHSTKGHLSGKMAMTIGPSNNTLRHATVRGAALDLSFLPPIGLFRGRLNVQANAKGRLPRPTGAASFEVQNFGVAKDPSGYEDFTVQVTSTPTIASLQLAMKRLLGGELTAHTQLHADNSLSGNVSMKHLPVETTTATPPQAMPIGGTISADVELQGTASKPTAQGTIVGDGMWLQQAVLGPVSLVMDPGPNNSLALVLTVSRDRLHVVSRLSLTRPFRSHIVADFQRLELDRYFPQIAERYGVRGFVTGKVVATVSTQGVETADIQLKELSVVLERNDATGRPSPLHLRARGPVAMTYKNEVLTVDNPIRLIGNSGEFTIEGRISSTKIDITAKGDIAARILQPYLASYMDTVEGNLAFSASIEGNPRSPKIAADVNATGLLLRPTGQDTVVKLQDARVRLSDKLLSFEGFDLLVRDEFSEHETKISVRGHVVLDAFVPSYYAVDVEGQLDGKLLTALFREQLSAGDGFAEVGVSVQGAAGNVGMDGDIQFETKDPLRLTPRGFPREVTLQYGVIDLNADTGEACFENFGGTIDNEGQFGVGTDSNCETNPTSVIGFEGLYPVDLDLSVWADNMPYRIPKTLDVTLVLDDWRIVGSLGENPELDVQGKIGVVDGEYRVDFNWGELITPQRVSEVEPPTWESLPIIANTQLNLEVDVPSFMLVSNIAELEFTSENLLVTGTASDPKLTGTVEVRRGSFRMPTVRAKFTRSSGTISFSPNQDINNPSLSLRSESDYRDVSGVDHLITLTLTGRLNENLEWDLSTASGLNKGQTTALLFSGRTTDQVRGQLGDQAPGLSQGSGALAKDEQTEIFDQLLNDVLSGVLEDQVGDYLEGLTSLDVVRLEIGKDSVGLRAEKHIYDSLRLLLEWSVGSRSQVFDIKTQFRLSDDFSIDGVYRQQRFTEASEEDIEYLRLRAVYRLVFR